MMRVVVTGLGIVSAAGTGREAFWRNLTAGRSGISQVTLFDTSAMPVRIGGQVRDIDEAGLRRRFPALAGERDRKVLLGLPAVAEALEDARLHGPPPSCTGSVSSPPAAGPGGDRRRAGHDRPVPDPLGRAVFYAGVGLEVFCLEDITPHAAEANLAAALARRVLGEDAGLGLPPVQTPLDRLGELACRRFGIGGERYTNGSACAAGAQAVGEALQLIRDGTCDVAVAGATDSMLNPLGLGGFSLLRVLSDENDQPQRACRPFDATRRGTVLGEGAAFLVIERLESALARHASVYAELLGYGSSMDAFAVSDPEPTGRGAVLAMRKALGNAGLSADDVDCLSAHGTGTVKNDIVETAAIKEVLGPRARQVPVHSVKSMTGHMIAASGAAEAVAAVLTITRGVVPPTINLRQADPECDLDYVPNRARPFAGRTVLSNSFGFGGQNATLIFGRYQP